MDYNVKYEILNYDSYNKRLNDLINKEHVNKVTKHKDIGITTCGFPIEHYSIGTGDNHILYMASCHGNEIITVDFITQLMLNLADGKGILGEIDLTKYTIDFIPCQNPEGFYITTYALKQHLKNIPDIEKHSYDYCDAYKEADYSVLDGKENPKGHYKILEDVTIDCIEEITIAHKKLKEKVKKIFENNEHEKGSLANFFANSNGVNLNDNNPYFNEILKERISKSTDGKVYGGRRDNCLRKDIPSPIGTSTIDINNFTFEPENIALFNFLESNNFLVFFNLHSTGGEIYSYPVYDENYDKDSLRYYFNTAISTSYSNEVLKTYKELKGVIDKPDYKNRESLDTYYKELSMYYKEGYDILEQPEIVTGVGDMLRRKYNGSLLIELSKIYGNPIGPYGEKLNIYLTMVANFNALNGVIKRLDLMNNIYNNTGGNIFIEQHGDKYILRVGNFITEAYIGENGLTNIPKEGSKTTPIGIFELGTLFGKYDKEELEYFCNKQIDFDYFIIKDTDYWCDDINIEYYNKIIDYNFAMEHNISGERLIDYVNKQYLIALEIKTNPDNIPGKTSAIFLHCKGDKQYTTGCVAVEKEDMIEILKRVNKQSKIIVKEKVLKK